jgi:hypothetical protein
MADKILFDESYLEVRRTSGVNGRLEDPGELAELRESIEETVRPQLAVASAPPAVARRSDHLVPVAAAAGAVAAIAVAAVLASIGLRQEVGDMALESYGHASGEGRVLQQYRQDSERVIRQKDSEVRTVLRQLEELRRRSEGLSAVVEKGLDIKESQLSEQVDAQLSRERAQLAALGTAEAEAEARLEALKERLELESRAELQRLRREADEALAAQRAQLLANVDRAALELAAAADDRLGAASRPEPEEAREDLAVAGEISSGLATALGLIRKSDYAGASAQLARVRALLAGASASRSVEARRATDLEVLDTLEAYMSVLRAQKAAAAPQPPAPAPRPELGPIIGRVTLVEGRRVVIEALVSTPLASGAPLSIQRLDAGRSPRDVVPARVVDVSGTRIVAYVDGSDLPSITDLVHLSAP